MTALGATQERVPGPFKSTPGPRCSSGLGTLWGPTGPQIALRPMQGLGQGPFDSLLFIAAKSRDPKPKPGVNQPGFGGPLSCAQERPRLEATEPRLGCRRVGLEAIRSGLVCSIVTMFNHKLCNPCFHAIEQSGAFQWFAPGRFKGILAACNQACAGSGPEAFRVSLNPKAPRALLGA